jgi:ABC-2 type transport system permease protein
MNTLSIIVWQEYKNRVTQKSFWIATLLVPMAIGFIMLISYWVNNMNDTETHVIVKDDSGLLKDSPIPDAADQKIFFHPINNRQAVKEKQIGILWIPADFNPEEPMKSPITFLSNKKTGLIVRQLIQKAIQEKLYLINLRNHHFTDEQIRSLNPEVSVVFQQSGEEQQPIGMPEVAEGIGYLAGFAIYFSMVLYGSMIAKSVTEEKNSRVIELIISSVKPGQLMLGKILGVALTGITQWIVWIVILLSATLFFSLSIPSGQMTAGHSTATDTEQIQQILSALRQLSPGPVLLITTLCYLLGFLLYGALFAAVGAVAGEGSDQNPALSMLITLPLIGAFILMTKSVTSPDSLLALIGSLFPLTSPVILPALAASSLPVWHIILSLLLQLFAVIFILQLSGNIYRQGILHFGSKVTFHTLKKWLTRSNTKPS